MSNDSADDFVDFGADIGREFDRAFDGVNRTLNDYTGLMSLGTLEFEGGRLSPRGTDKAKKKQKEALNAQIRERERLRNRELEIQERDARTASSAAGNLRKASARRSSRDGGASGDALGTPPVDFLGL